MPSSLFKEVTADSLDLDVGVLADFAAQVGPLAIIDLETTGLAQDPKAEILELGAVLIDADSFDSVRILDHLVKPSSEIPAAIERITGISNDEVVAAPALHDHAAEIAAALDGRVLIAHNAEFEQSFLGRFLAPEFERATYLDTQDLLALTHPDAQDMRLETFTRIFLQSEEYHRAFSDALDTARILARIALDSRNKVYRYATARSAISRFVPESPWLALLGTGGLAPPAPGRSAYVKIVSTDEPPIPFCEEAVAEVLRDEARGRRYFKNFRVREEQVRMAQHFVRNLADGGPLLLEGGTGVGKSLAYLAAAIPFVMEQAEQGDPTPVIIATRTKLLQDQLLEKDIAAAARFLGYPELKALSIKGRANYICARHFSQVLSEGSESSIFPEDRMAYAVLLASARIRTNGEVGSLPIALRRRFPALHGLLNRSVAWRSDHCTREQCAKEKNCPFGERRAALAKANIVVANHDLLLRWPPDYPRLAHVIVDEVHELAGVVDEVFAEHVTPEEILASFDEAFGRGGSKRSTGLLPAARRKALAKDLLAWRRGLQQDLIALGRSLQPLAGDYDEVQVPVEPSSEFAAAETLCSNAAKRIQVVTGALSSEVEKLAEKPEGLKLERVVDELNAAAHSLEKAFQSDPSAVVTAFEGVSSPFDRWRLLLRPVAPASIFHENFFSSLQSFAGVSASLFINNDAFAALGELELEDYCGEELQQVCEASPFDYANKMRVVALSDPEDLVAETAKTIAQLARTLGGRTLGLFTSLRRLHEVAQVLNQELRDEGIEILLPRRAIDDPNALIERFRKSDRAVLLGARRFWQGLDIPGEDLQAVVIEKLPFEVPTELRRRREERLKASGVNVFQRYALGKMLLHLKQMVGRLIRSENDRGLVVIVESRSKRSYFRRLQLAMPPQTKIQVCKGEWLKPVLDDLELP